LKRDYFRICSKLGGRGIIRGVVFGGRGIIRGVVFGGRGITKYHPSYNAPTSKDHPPLIRLVFRCTERAKYYKIAPLIRPPFIVKGVAL
jgi:hypothetical protein